eukprot:11109125-Lingulodinium_polyedra.AAC.1
MPKGAIATGIARGSALDPLVDLLERAQVEVRVPRQLSPLQPRNHRGSNADPRAMPVAMAPLGI